MKTFKATVLCLFFGIISSHSQSIQDIIDKVDIDVLSLTVQEFSGEVSTVVDGNTVTITNRQQSNNDLAADYLVQKLEQLDNITITDQSFNSNGRNIIATQLGKTNPDDIYIICAHYDSVADYCADDNATGTTAVLEAARLLSTQCLDNTIVYALWDEEEIGLNAPEETSNSDSLLNDYLSNNISVSIDSVSKKYNYIGHEYEEEYCYIYIEFVDIKEVNQLYINCTILGEVGMSDHGHSHQSNLVNIKINGQLKSLYLNPHNREATIEFN